jgi:hypothetical protein
VSYTASEIREMVEHVEGCARCCGGDPDILAGLYDESMPPEEIEGYIKSAHGTGWRRFLATHAG